MAIEIQPPQPSVAPVRMSFWDYLKAYESVEGVQAEWTPEKVEIHRMGNNIKHQRILLFLSAAFGFFLDRYQLGEIILAGLPMYLGDDKSARQPDLMVVLDIHRERIKDAYLEGTADIAIEIVSPESFERDYATKFAEYESARIPEYWLIDPIRNEVSVYVLGSDNYYHRSDYDERGRLISAVLPGFTLDPTILWQESLPGTTAIPLLVEQMG